MVVSVSLSDPAPARYRLAHPDWLDAAERITGAPHRRYTTAYSNKNDNNHERETAFLQTMQGIVGGI